MKCQIYSCSLVPDLICLCSNIYLCQMHSHHHFIENRNHIIERLKTIDIPQRIILTTNLKNRIKDLELLKIQLYNQTVKTQKLIEKSIKSIIIQINSQISNYIELLTKTKYTNSQINEIKSINSTKLKTNLISLFNLKENIIQTYSKKFFEIVEDKAEDLKIQRNKFFETHSKVIECVGISNDGKILVTGSDDGFVRLWNVKEKKQVAFFIHHQARVSCVAVSRDKPLAVTGSQDRTLGLWDIQQKYLKCVYRGHSGCVFTVGFNRGSSIIVSGDNKDILFWNVGKPECFRKIFVGEAIISSVISSEFYFAGIRCDLEKFELNSYEQLISIKNAHDNDINSIAITNDQSVIITCSYDKTVKLWDARTLKLISYPLLHESSVFALTLTSDEKYIISGCSDSSIYLWRLDDKKIHKKFSYHKGRIMGVTSFSDNIFSISWDKKICIFSISTEKFCTFFSLNHFNESSETIKNNLVTYGDNNNVIIYNLDQKEAHILKNGHSSQVTSTCLSSNLNFLISSSIGKENNLIFWNFHEKVKISELFGHKESVNCVDISTDELTAISGDEKGVVFLWDLMKNKHFSCIEGKFSKVYLIKFLKDGKFAVAQRIDNKIIIWDTRYKCIYGTFSRFLLVQKILITNDDKFIVSAGNAIGVHVWNVRLKKVEIIFMNLGDADEWLKKNEDFRFELSRYIF